MSVKKKLLIAMGDSFTEGVGCYPDHLIKKYNLENYNQRKMNYSYPDRFYAESRPYFHRYGWPSRLQRFMRYDKLINIGLGGSANSGQLKRFIEEFDDPTHLSEEYDVLVIWMLSFSHRISFYIDYHIKNFHGESLDTHMNTSFKSNNFDLADQYYLSINNIDADPILETLFYIKVMQHICSNLKFNFLFTSVCNKDIKLLRQIYTGKNFMNEFYSNMFLAHRDELNNYLEENHSKTGCGHLNSRGYEETAKRMYNYIKTYYPQYIPDEEYMPTSFYSTYSGNLKDMSYLFKNNI